MNSSQSIQHQIEDESVSIAGNVLHCFSLVSGPNAFLISSVSHFRSEHQKMEGDKSKGTPPPPPTPPPLPPSSQSPSSPFRKEYSPKGNLQFAAAGSRPPRPQIISQRAASGNNYYYTGSAQGQSTSSARQRTYSANNAYGNSPPRRESNQSLDSQQGTTFPVHLRQPSLSHESIGFGSSARSGARYGDQSDANLILASLERPALEDAAESVSVLVTRIQSLFFLALVNLSTHPLLSPQNTNGNLDPDGCTRTPQSRFL